METTQKAKFSIDITRANLRAALIFAAKGDIRYYLNSVCLHVGECGDARLIGCDGHRLGLVHLCDASGAAPGEYIIPREAVENIKKAVRGFDGLTLAIDGEAFTISDNYGGAIIAGGKLVDGKYPDWQRVMPQTFSGEAGNYNPQYLFDVSKAVKELGGKNGFYDFTQNGNSSALAVYENLTVIIMPMRGADEARTAPPAYCTPRRMPRAVIENATGGQAFPCDPAQNVDDKRAPVGDIEAPAVVAHCGADIAAWIDPDGALQAAGLLMVAHIGDKVPESAPAEDDAEYLAYLASMQADKLQAAA